MCRKKTYELRVRKQAIKPGAWVWYYYPRRWTGRSPKWWRNYVGPMLVTKVISPTNVCIQKHRRSKPQIVHVSKLKPCKGITPCSWLGQSESTDEEPEDDPGLSARLGETPKRRTTKLHYMMNLLKEMRGQPAQNQTSVSSTTVDHRRLTAVRHRRVNRP